VCIYSFGFATVLCTTCWLGLSAERLKLPVDDHIQDQAVTEETTTDTFTASPSNVTTKFFISNYQLNSSYAEDTDITTAAIDTTETTESDVSPRQRNPLSTGVPDDQYMTWLNARMDHTAQPPQTRDPDETEFIGTLGATKKPRPTRHPKKKKNENNRPWLDGLHMTNFSNIPGANNTTESTINQEENETVIIRRDDMEHNPNHRNGPPSASNNSGIHGGSLWNKVSDVFSAGMEMLNNLSSKVSSLLERLLDGGKC